MTSPIRLCLVLHNHQPVGNFGHIFEQAYQDGYLPFLDVFEPYENLSLSLHLSGPLAKWLEQHHADYLARIRGLVLAGRIEIIGGAFYEPILTMLPVRDRIGQIRSYTAWLQETFDAKVQGMWVAERVWESCLTADIAAAGIRYTVLDDFHFRQAGLPENELHGFYLTEDAGATLRVFPGSEKLRYLIPFAEPQETIAFLRDLAEQHPGTVAVFGDDGEKFGIWPDTRKHVYDDGWLRRFFDALNDGRDWIHTSTLADAVERTPPRGKIYLPDASYREMTEWSQPVPRQLEYSEIRHELEGTPRGQSILSFVRGGFWRNFKTRYPETNEMYARMMYVSGQLEKWMGHEGTVDEACKAREHLYRGQCNCAYWHGAFGGLYLPHLRNAIYAELIAAENLIERNRGRSRPWTEVFADDFNFDGRPEVRLANDQLVAWVSPANGGFIYELDVREICHNLLATMDRVPEAYHEKVKQGQNEHAGEAASIHDRVVFKQADLDRKLIYDWHRRKSLIDHFWAAGTTLESVVAGTATDQGDFATGDYHSRIRRGEDRSQVQLTRTGSVAEVPLTIRKAITIFAGSEALEVAYLLEGLPPDQDFLFGVEFNFSGLPPAADDRYFHFGDSKSAGPLQTCIESEPMPQIHLTDQWLGIDCGISCSQPARFWTYPVETVSQSEAGFELVHQSVVVQPCWQVRGDAAGSWSVRINLQLDTRLARSRKQNGTALAAT